LRSSLVKLCAQFDVKSALLLEGKSDGSYQSPDASQSLPANGLLVNRLRWFSTPLPLSEADLDSWLRWAEENKPKHVAEIQTLKQTGARIAVALRTRQEILACCCSVAAPSSPRRRNTCCAAPRTSLP
jgi:hypothetical protein